MKHYAEATHTMQVRWILKIWQYDNMTI
jgi:hypothetical protein